MVGCLDSFKLPIHIYGAVGSVTEVLGVVGDLFEIVLLVLCGASCGGADVWRVEISNRATMLPSLVSGAYCFSVVIVAGGVNASQSVVEANHCFIVVFWLMHIYVPVYASLWKQCEISGGGKRLRRYFFWYVETR